MTLGDMILQYRKEHGLSQRSFAMKCKLSNGYIAMIERNKNPQTKKPIVPRLDQIKAIATAMNMTADELIRATDGDTPVTLVNNVFPMSSIEFHRIPLIGSAAAGEPIDDEEVDIYIDGPFRADCAIRVKGESMEPTYLDGDVLYIRSQPDIDHDGQIAVVVCGDEACVKHVYRQQEGLLLTSDNPQYAPMFKRFDDYDNNIRVIGKVIGYTRLYKE